MGKSKQYGSGVAAAVVFTAVVAVAVCIASPHVYELYGQVLESFLHEELDGIREFIRQPTWAGLKAGLQEVWAIIGPGGKLHPGWFLEHKGHLVIEGLLIVIIAVMLLQSRFSPKATEEEEGLTEKVCCSQAAGSVRLSCQSCQRCLMADQQKQQLLSTRDQ